MNTPILTPRRPHLLRAFYDWLIENDLTPHLVVDATLPMVEVPQDYVIDGQIVLNIAPRAVADFFIENDLIQFSARFGGQPMTISVPMYAAMAIYARENGAGTMFEPEQSYDSLLAELEDKSHSSTPVIGLVQDEEVIELADSLDDSKEAEAKPEQITDMVDSDEPTPPKKGRPSLTVVK